MLFPIFILSSCVQSKIDCLLDVLQHNHLPIKVKPLNSGHLRVLKHLSVIESCPLLGGNFKKIVIFGIKCFVRYSWHLCYLGCPLLGGFAVFHCIIKSVVPTLHAAHFSKTYAKQLMYIRTIFWNFSLDTVLDKQH